MREIATFFEQRPSLKGIAWQAFVLWLNREDDPGFGTLIRLARKPNPQMVSLDLIKLLKKLPDESLALNVLRPLLAKNEREVRRNVVQWVKNIRQQSEFEANLEERLISVMSQLIEQKFKSLSYEELSHMLRLTPFREMDSVKEVIKEVRVEMLSKQIQLKFNLSSEMMDIVSVDLEKLDTLSLEVLVEQILRVNSFEQLEVWLADHLPQRVA